MHTETITHLPLTRRVGLVRAFATLVRAMPNPRPSPLPPAIPDYLRKDLGFPPAVRTRSTTAPPEPPRFMPL